MDEKQLNYEFMSILSESHPGLTFEEYRDSCVFLLFYQYLCIRFEDSLEERYAMSAMVRMAVRGKLQMPTFIKFIEAAAPFLVLAGAPFRLTDFSFYRKMSEVQSLEKQKSFARFIRKLIKKMDGWEDRELLLAHYGEMFELLMGGFARMKKETYFSKGIQDLHRMFFSQNVHTVKNIFLPGFQYGILLGTMTDHVTDTQIYGFEQKDSFRELLEILCYMKDVPLDSVHLCKKEEWSGKKEYAALFDAIAIFMPDGVESGTLLMEDSPTIPAADLMKTVAKGEFPLILSALPLLASKGIMTVVVPSALLYREGKEALIRKYIVEEADCLEMVMLLPDNAFQSTGQNEVMLLFRKDRENEDVMFFDCSHMDNLEGERLLSIEKAWKERKSVPGFCARTDKKTIKDNDYNLNLPRYITRSVRMTEMDITKRRERIEEIDRELAEIDRKIAMYRRDMEL